MELSRAIIEGKDIRIAALETEVRRMQVEADATLEEFEKVGDKMREMFSI